MIAKIKKIALAVWVYIKVNGHSLDVLANTLLGGAEAQTASARWGESPQKTFLFRYGCKFLDFVTRTEHCKQSYEKYAKIREAIK